MKNQLDDINPGEAALVRCITVETYSQTIKDYKRIECVPILPYPPHSDLEIIGFAPLHYHFDYRFFTIELLQDILESDCYFDPEDWASRIQLAEEAIGEPYDLELLCEREPVIAGDWYGFVGAVEDHFAGTKAILDSSGCRTCPHRGYAVQRVTPDNITNKAIKSHHLKAAFGCPGHGLVFDEAGKVIQRVKITSTEWEPGAGGY